MERFERLNKKLVGFCAVAVLFLGSLYYFAAVAFKDADVLQARQSYRTTYEN
jgi:hypothetical protein